MISWPKSLSWNPAGLPNFWQHLNTTKDSSEAATSQTNKNVITTYYHSSIPHKPTSFRPSHHDGLQKRADHLLLGTRFSRTRHRRRSPRNEFLHPNTMIHRNHYSNGPIQHEFTDRYLGEHNMETATDELPKV